ncbi:hypothetical protein [uncultured Dysgonomonas sp.]
MPNVSRSSMEYYHPIFWKGAINPDTILLFWIAGLPPVLA